MTTDVMDSQSLAAPVSRPRLDLVQCFEGRPWEEDWYANVLGDFDVQVHKSPDYSLVIPNAIYMVGGSLGLGVVPQSFLDQVKQAGNCGLIHLGDEFLRGPYRVYSNFAFVIRTHYASFVQSPGVLTIPLGYSNNMDARRGLASSQRKYAWAFTGNTNLVREHIAREWKTFEKNFCFLIDLREGHKHLSRGQFLELLDDSAFIPCPIGNVHLESLRIYEALERGTIPIVSTRHFLAYFDRVLGRGHPIPQFLNWASARAWAEDIYSRPEDLDALQRNVLAWWADKKDQVREQSGQFVREGLAGAHREHLSRDFAHRSALFDQPPRLWELARHHDAVAWRGRAQLAARRIGRRLGIIPPLAT
jgi:hypothetical protein